MKKNTFLTVIILLLLISFHLINNYIWLKADQTLVNNITPEHLTSSLTFYRLLITKEESIIKKVENIFYLFNKDCDWFLAIWPRFVYLVTAGFRPIFGHSILAVKFSTSSFYFIILIVSVYFLGHYYRNAKTGCLASFIVSMYPGIFGMSREYTLDLPLVAMVSLCAFFLLKTDKFRRSRYSLIFSLFFVIGILTKLQIIFFITPLMIYCLGSGIRKDMIDKQGSSLTKKRIVNFLLSIFIVFLISGVWWYSFWRHDTYETFRGYLTSFSSVYTGKPVGLVRNEQTRLLFNRGKLTISLLGVYDCVYYLDKILLYTTPIMSIGAVFSVFYLSKSKRLPKEVLIWIIISYFIISVLIPKDSRYVLPTFPAIALLTAYGVEELKKGFIKRWIIFLIVAVGIGQYFAYSYFGLDLFARYKLSTLRSMGYNVRPPTKGNYSTVVDRFIKKIEERDDLRNASVGLISDAPWGSALKYYIGSYSALNFWKEFTRYNLLIGYRKYNYLIVTDNLVAIQPTFDTLYRYDYGNRMTRESIAEIIKDFKTFKIIDSDILNGEGMLKIFLLSRH